MREEEEEEVRGRNVSAETRWAQENFQDQFLADVALLGSLIGFPCETIFGVWFEIQEIFLGKN